MARVKAARRARRRDQDVLEAATKVFFEQGYASASVQDVADELGILKGSLYHYIETKEDLLFRLFEDVHNDVERILDDVRAADDLGPRERLKLYVRRQVEYSLANRPRITVYYHDMELLSEERRARVAARRRVHTVFVTDLVKELQRTGEANASLDPRVLTNCIFSTIIWIYRWYQPGGRLSRTKIAGQIADFAVGGLRGDQLATR
jgi:TetR/AcrR family transcriptional regulator, cholesterol catabolism regulator